MSITSNYPQSQGPNKQVITFWEGPVLPLGCLKLETLHFMKLLERYRHLESVGHLNSNAKLAWRERATKRGVILSANNTLLS